MRAALLIACLCAPLSAQDSIVIKLAGEPFATVVTEGAQFPYIYPLLGPGGARMTRGFPMERFEGESEDHPHHRSMWFTHGNVNGVDFWHEGGEHPGRIETAETIYTAGKGKSTVTLQLRWITDGDVRILEEARTYTFRGDANERSIDVDCKLRAVTDVVFGDTKEGSMALRLHPALRIDGEVAAGSAKSSAGHTGGAVWGKRARWVHYSGPIGGKPMGVTIYDHPHNPRHPTWWHARKYGLFAANPFGIHDFEGKPAGTGDLALGQGETLRLRYRVVLHAGLRTDAELEAGFHAFAPRLVPPVTRAVGTAVGHSIGALLRALAK